MEIYLQQKQKNGESLKLTLDNNFKIYNRRTEKEFDRNNIKVKDKLDLENVYKKQGEITFAEDGKVFVIRNIHNEELKQELISGEVDFDIENITKRGNNYILTGTIRDLYYINDYSLAESFEIEVTVTNDTTVLGVKGKLEEQLKNPSTSDTLFITFNEKELKKGNLLAENIEVMGC